MCKTTSTCSNHLLLRLVSLVEYYNSSRDTVYTFLFLVRDRFKEPQLNVGKFLTGIELTSQAHQVQAAYQEPIASPNNTYA